MLTINAGATDQTVYLFIQDSSVTTGAGLTGLVYNTASLVAYYVSNRGAATAITLATLASATAAHADGGFIEVSAANMPGVYRLDLPDAAVASGNQVIIQMKGAANMVPVAKEIFLTAIDMQDATAMGVSRIDAAVTSRMATYTQPTGFLAATFPTTVASPTNITAGTITTVTNLTNLPAIPNNWLTAAGTSADFGTEVGTAVWATTSRILTANTNLSIPTDASIRGAVGLASGNLDTQLSNLSTKSDGVMAAVGTVESVVDDIKVTTDKVDTMLVLDGGVWQYTANALELAPNGGGGGGLTAADVWTYTGGSGRILTDGTNIVLDKGTGITGFNDLSEAQVNAQVDLALSDVGMNTTVTGRIDAAISSRMATFTYTAPDNTGIAEIKAKTDLIPASPASVSDIPTITDIVNQVWAVNMASITGEASRSPLNAIRILRNSMSTASGSLVVKKEDDTTDAWTATITTDGSALPITGTDPA